MGRLTYNLESVNFSDLLQDVLDRYSNEFVQARSTLDFKAEPNLIGQFDYSRVEQIVVNLVSNALKYARGAIIHVELTHVTTKRSLWFRIPVLEFPRIGSIKSSTVTSEPPAR